MMNSGQIGMVDYLLGGWPGRRKSNLKNK